MDKKDLIDQLLSQGLTAGDNVQVTTEKEVLVGKLTDAKVKEVDKKEYIGITVSAPKGKVVAPIPKPILVSSIVSIQKL